MTILNKITGRRLKVSGEQVFKNNSGEDVKSKGFSLIEVVIGIALVGVALMGLAQLFTFSIMNNSRSDRMTNAIFLAQQKIDFLRNQPAPGLQLLALNPIDEQMDINSDGIIDYRRITQIQQQTGFSWDVRVRIFSGAQAGVDTATLIQNLDNRYKVRADISTVISR